jgi:hypothetical protein
MSDDECAVERLDVTANRMAELLNELDVRASCDSTISQTIFSSCSAVSSKRACPACTRQESNVRLQHRLGNTRTDREVMLASVGHTILIFFLSST